MTTNQSKTSNAKKKDPFSRSVEQRIRCCILYLHRTILYWHHAHKNRIEEANEGRKTDSVLSKTGVYKRESRKASGWTAHSLSLDKQDPTHRPSQRRVRVCERAPVRDRSSHWPFPEYHSSLLLFLFAFAFLICEESNHPLHVNTRTSNHGKL